MIYYTSDLHFGHTNILKYEKSPFKTIEERDRTIVNRINEKCSKDDDLYILGDIALKYSKYVFNLLKELKSKLHLIVGNHDNTVLKYMSIKEKDSIFIEVKQYKRIKDNDRDVILFHYPIFNWDCQKHGSYHIYGHVHDMPNFQLKVQKSYNAYIKLYDYYPITLDELLQKDDILNLKINKNS